MIASLVVIAWSILSLGVRVFQAMTTTDVAPQFLLMSATNGVGFLLAGVGVLLYAYGNPSRQRKNIALISGGIITAWGMGCAASELGFFSSMFATNERLAASVPISCVILAGLGLAILTLSFRTSGGHRPSQYFAVATVMMGGIVGIGYLYRVSPIYDSTTYGSIDGSTAVLSVIAGLALLCTHPTEGLMRMLMSPDIGGTLLRRLLPFAIGLPILAGWLRILGQRQGWYSFDFGVAVVVGVMLLILLTCLWYVAYWADRVDRERRGILEAFTEQEARLHLAAAAARIGYWRWMEATDSIEMDEVSGQLLGIHPDATITMNAFRRAICTEDRSVFEHGIEEARHNRTPFEIECRPVAKSQVKWISLSGFPPAHPDISSYRFHGVMVDITERRTAQEALQDSQQRINSIVQSAMDAIITLDQDQNILLFNKAAETLFQCSADEALGTPISRFIPVGVLQRDHSRIMKFQQSTVTARPLGRPGAVTGRRTDGHEFPIEASISQVSFGGQSLCTVILRDITERLQNEVAFREQEARFRNMADSAPVMMFVTDSEGFCSYLNRQWYEFTGQTEETGLKTGWLNHVHEDDRSRLIALLNACGDDVERRQLECRVRRHDGEFRWALCSILNRIDENGARAGCIASIIDITDHKLAEHTLKRSAEELEQQVAERTAALSRSQERLRALSHQLTRTEHQERRRIAGELHDYLAQLLVAAHLKLAQDTRPAETKQDRTLVKDLERILDEALTYTRLLVAKLSPPVLYHLGLPAALQWLAQQMEEHQLIIETAFDLPPELPKLPDDVAAILFQSVRELLFNVVKHAGSPHVRIALRTTADQDLVIVVSDQGQGFDADQLDQASTSTTSFGLFSIKERMEALGGSVQIDTRMGQGTSVTLVCPLTLPEKIGLFPAIPDAHDGTLNVPHSRSSWSTRVLLADDHAMVRQGIRALLERHDDLTVVGEAWDGQHACELVEALKPDVIVMDANMPHLDGIEATRRIKQSHPRIVIIGLSVQSAAQVANSMLQAGASRYLTKESAADQLYETIMAAVAHRGSSATDTVRGGTSLTATES
jgi:PAS domain S-box-containing protein